MSKEDQGITIVGIDADIVVYVVCYVVEAKGEPYRKVCDTIMNKIFLGTSAQLYAAYLTKGPCNFRIARATTWPYKGNRKDKDKPTNYEDVRKYLQKKWKAQMITGMEADDALVIARIHHGIDFIIATKDKDLWQQWGHHWNMNTDELMFISEAQAHRNLWQQVILGDVQTDNIPGLSHAAKFETPGEFNPKVRALQDHLYGPVKAKEVLDNTPPLEYAKKILELYIDAYGDDEYLEEIGEQRFYETYDLVKMLEERPEGNPMTYDLHTVPPPRGLEFSDY